MRRLSSAIEPNRTHKNVAVRLCSIAELNRTPIEQLSLIGDWFLVRFVRLTTPGIYRGQNFY